MSWEAVSGRSRNTGTDTAHERTKIGASNGTYTKTSGQSTGFTNQMAGVLAGDIMDRAMADKMKMVAESEELSIARGEEKEHDDKLANKDIDDADDDLDVIRARRLDQMKKRQKEKEELKAKGHGTYEEIVESEFLDTVTKSHLAVVHFYHPQFERSKIVNMHLEKMAKKFFRTRFVRLNADKSPFFVSKLQIQTLPTCCLFIDGVLQYKQIGFNDLPGGDEFKTGHLAKIFRDSCEVITEDFDSDGEI